MMKRAADLSSSRAVTAVIPRRNRPRWWGGCRLGFCLLAATIAAHAQTASYRTLYPFNPSNLGGTPVAGLTLGADGLLYGVASAGGSSYDNGSVFKIAPGGSAFSLHVFGNLDANGFNADGAHPRASLVQSGDGTFYGTTTAGGANGAGTIFSITAQGAFVTLHSFGVLNSGGGNIDGAAPGAALYQSQDGYFYGTAANGGANGTGTFFRFKPAPGKTNPAVAVLHSFGPLVNGANADGAHPIDGVVQARDGNFYGTVNAGGANGTGTIYIFYAGGGFRVVHTFAALSSVNINSDGANPSTLIIGGDGNFYGTTNTGGQYAGGTIFTLPLGGTLLDAFDFDPSAASYDTHPTGPLFQASDGSFYGVTTKASSQNRGQIFQFVFARGPLGSYNGTLHLLYTFNSSFDSSGANLDGQGPVGGLVEGVPGTFYGVTSAGGQRYGGVAFQLNAPPVITSPVNVTARVGTPFTYQITATNSPVSYSAQLAPTGNPSARTTAAASAPANLGHGLFFDPRTGVISGTPTSTGTLNLIITASNVAATGRGAVNITISAR